MVRITSSNKRKKSSNSNNVCGIVDNNNSNNKNKLLNIHFFFLVIAGFICVAVSLFFYLANLEEKNDKNFIRSEQHLLRQQINQQEQQQQKDIDTTGTQQQQPVTTKSPMMITSRMVSATAPFILYGTAWKKEKTAEYVEQAIKAGFRHIDTACQPKHYNEALVGVGWTKAAADLGLQRQDIFLQTKYTSYNGQDPNKIPYDPKLPLEEQVKQSVQVSLKNLQTTYIDSLVMHGLERTIEDTMKVYHTMETFVEDGTVHQLGISNCYNYDLFVQIYEQAKIKPSVIQNRFYSQSNFDVDIRQFCKEQNVKYQSFWTLTGNRDALNSKEVKDMAKSKNNITPQTLMFAYMLQLGYGTPLSGTTSIEHMKDDVTIMERIQSGEKIFDSAEEMALFENLLGIPPP